jgi:hypothetical protein
MIQQCYDGPMGTEGVGECVGGLQVCNEQGNGFEPCEGSIAPTMESCATAGKDEDCDGVEAMGAVDMDSGCVCMPGEQVSCYTGPGGTQGVGVCEPGKATCEADGVSMSACMGEVTPGVESCVTAADEDCDGVNPLCPGDTQWSKRAGDGVTQAGTAITSDANDNVIAAGSFGGTINLGGNVLTSSQGTDVYIVKTDPAGAHQWSKAFGSTGTEVVAGVGTDTANNIVMVGTFDGNNLDFGGGALMPKGSFDVFAAKFDPAGNHLWSVALGGAGQQQPTGMAVSPAGDVYICGTYQGTPDFGNGALMNGGGNDFFLLKLAGANGATMWSKGFGDVLSQVNVSVASDAAGNVILTGTLVGTVNFGGLPLAAQGADAFVAKFSSGGMHAWSMVFGDAMAQVGQGVATDSGADILLTGSFNGVIDFGGNPMTATNADAYVAKLNENGMHVWSKSFGIANDQYGTDVAIGEGSSVIVTGEFNNSIDYGPGGVQVAGALYDGYVVKLSSAGTFMWQRSFTGNGNQRPNDVASDTKGNVLLVGEFDNTIDFGMGMTHTSMGEYDMFFAKLQK